jgi:hypothetical protein
MKKPNTSEIVSPIDLRQSELVRGTITLQLLQYHFVNHLAIFAP